jgi:hypothetical protein
MIPLQNMSRKAIVFLALVICYAPFSWVLLVSENRWLWIKSWPILPGIMLADLLRRCLSQFRIEVADWLRLPIVILMSVAILAGILFLMFRISRCRLVVAALALVALVFLSFGAYGLYRA